MALAEPDPAQSAPALAAAAKCPDGFDVRESDARDGGFACTPRKAAATPPQASQPNSKKEAARGFTQEALVNFAADHDVGKAMASYTKALEQDPGYAPARFGLGVMLEAQGDWTGARSTFAQLEAVGKGGALVAAAKEERSRIDTAIKLEATQEGRRTRQYDSFISQARMLLAAGQPAAAAERVRAAQKLDESKWQAYAMAGEIALVSQRLPEAGRLFQAASARASEDALRKKLNEAAYHSLGVKVFRDCSVCPEMVRIPGENYAIGKYEVTQGQWKAIMGSNPSRFSGCGDDCPVESVSWDDAQDYIRRLNAKTGKQYRLPTEAEWEHACHAGSQQEYCGGDDLDNVGWWDGNSGNQTHPVGQKRANAWGLYDMSGNVAEFTQSCWQGACGKGEQLRVTRGGQWCGFWRLARAAVRGKGFRSVREYYNGFRLARMLP